MDQLPDLPDTSGIDNPWQALVLVVLILAVLVVPSVLTVLGNARVKRVETTLTKNNGGSSNKDQFDRIEQKLDGLAERVTALEAAQAEPERLSLVRRLLG